MRIPVVTAVLFLASTVTWAGGVRGPEPRSESSRYPASFQGTDSAIGAGLLSPEQVNAAFVTELGRNYLVLEVALYPGKGTPIEVPLRDFTLRIAGTDLTAKPASPKTIAAMVQKSTAQEREVAVNPHVGIGYETGTTYDPTTGKGRRGGGWVTSAGVAVGVETRQTASTEKDREVMELELTERSLPEGQAAGPVAGYLYFPIPARKKDLAYQLEYQLKPERLVLPLR